MLNLQTIAFSGTKVGYSVRRRADGAVLDPAANSFGPPPRPSPDVPIGLPAIGEEAKPNLGRFSLTLPDPMTSSWEDGIYEVWFHNQTTNTIFDGYAVRMIDGDDTPPEFRPSLPPIPAGPVVPTLVNGGFALPILPPRTAATSPPDAWTATGSAWLASNGSPGTEGNSPAPDEGQFAVISGGSILSQLVPEWEAGPYAVYVKFAKRASSGTHRFSVLVDGAPIATYTANRTDFSGVMTPTFTVSDGSHTLGFGGVSDADPNASSLIDRVQLVRVG